MSDTCDCNNLQMHNSTPRSDGTGRAHTHLLSDARDCQPQCTALALLWASRSERSLSSVTACHLGRVGGKERVIHRRTACSTQQLPAWHRQRGQEAAACRLSSSCAVILLVGCLCCCPVGCSQRGWRGMGCNNRSCRLHTDSCASSCVSKSDSADLCVCVHARTCSPSQRQGVASVYHSDQPEATSSIPTRLSTAQLLTWHAQKQLAPLLTNAARAPIDTNTCCPGGERLCSRGGACRLSSSQWGI